MPVYTPEQYHALQRRRLEVLNKNASKAQTLGAEKYATRLRMYVPMKSGRLKRSIRRNKNVVRVGASKNGFPYFHWINQTTPQFVTLRMKRSKRTGRFVSKHTPDKYAHVFTAVYGLSPANWNWTGKARFQKIAFYESRQDWRVIIERVRRKSILGEVI